MEITLSKPQDVTLFNETKDYVFCALREKNYRDALNMAEKYDEENFGAETDNKKYPIYYSLSEHNSTNNYKDINESTVDKKRLAYTTKIKDTRIDPDYYNFDGEIGHGLCRFLFWAGIVFLAGTVITFLALFIYEGVVNKDNQMWIYKVPFLSHFLVWKSGDDNSLEWSVMVGVVLAFDIIPSAICFILILLTKIFGPILFLPIKKRHDVKDRAINDKYAKDIEEERRSVVNEAIKASKNDYETKYKFYQDKHDEFLAMKEKLANLISEAKKASDEADLRLELASVYHHDIIALSSFIGYVETGRCLTFFGPRGVIDAYETDLTQKKICDHLETVETLAATIVLNQNKELANEKAMIHNQEAIIKNQSVLIRCAVEGLNELDAFSNNVLASLADIKNNQISMERSLDSLDVSPTVITSVSVTSD